MLKFNVTGDKIQLTSPRSFNSGSKGYYTAEFTFDSDWDGLIPHIVVIENGTQRADEVIIDNIHKIATTESGVMQISVYGLDADGKKCISCNYVCIEVKQGAYTGVVPLPKDIWDGYQIIVLGYMERAEVAASNAKAAEENIKGMSVTATEGETVSVKQTMTDAGIRLDFTIPRGEQGIQGDKGDKGDTGAQGIQGEQGLQGEKGADGYTPIKGVDYFTEDDIEEIENDLKKLIPVVDTEFSFGSNNPIANTTVALKFESLDSIVGMHATQIYGLTNRVTNVEKSVAEVKTSVGDIETALDGIIAIQETLIGGGSV